MEHAVKNKLNIKKKKIVMQKKPADKFQLPRMSLRW